VMGGRGMAIAGLILGYLAIALGVIGFVAMILMVGMDRATRPAWDR